MSENTEQKQRPEHLYKPGQSGNPDGRPKGSKNFSTIFREAVKKVAKANGIEEADVEYDLVIKAISEAKKGKYQYHKDIFDRVYGKADDNLNVSGDLSINLVSYGDKKDNPDSA